MNEIFYLNHCKPELTELGKLEDKNCWELKPELFVLKTSPSRCKVTINGNINIENVYIYKSKDDTISLYQRYIVQKAGFRCGVDGERWGIITPIGLVLEFKSDNYVIEHQ